MEPRLNSPSPVNGGDEDRQCHLAGVVFDHYGGENGTLSLAEVIVARLGDEKSFSLVKVSPRRWRMESSIELPPGVEGVDCVIRTKDLKEIVSVRIGCVEGREEGSPEAIFSKSIQSLDGQLQFLVSWQIIKTVSGAEVGAAGLPSIPDLVKLSETQYNAFRSSGRLIDISKSISVLWRAVDVGSDDSTALPGLLSNLGGYLCYRHDHTGNPQDVDEAISLHQKAMSLTPEDHTDLPARLADVGNSFLHRFNRTGHLIDLNEALSAHRRAVRLAPEGHAGLPYLLSSLGTALQLFFERTGDLRSLTEAISTRSKAVLLTSQTHPHMPLALNNLGGSLQSRFSRTGDLRDLDKAISARRHAVRLTPEGQVDLPTRLANLGNSFLSRFERAGDPHDLGEATSTHRQAVRLTPEKHAALPLRLNCLGTSLQSQFELTGDLPDLTEGISSFREAILLTPEGHSLLPFLLANLGKALRLLFERTGESRDIAEAVSVRSQAVELTPVGHPQLPSRLSSLGSTFLSRFKLTGDLRDVAEAISAQNKALSLTPAGHAELPSRLNNLGNAYYFRFRHAADLRDIDECISAQTKAVALAPEGYAMLPRLLSNLGSSLASRYQATGKPDDISQAISSQRRAVSLTPEGHAELPSRLNNVGASLQCRLDRTGELPDVDGGILEQLRAVRLTAEGDTGLPGILSNLGSLYVHRFKQTNHLSDINEAISVQKQAVSLTPEGHAALPSQLHNLAVCCHRRFASTGRAGDFDEGVRTSRLAATCAIGPPNDRFRAARLWARELNRLYPNSPDVLPAFSCAIGLLLIVAGLEQTLQRRYSIIQEHACLPLEAANTAFRLRHFATALEWLEQSRCLVWGQQNQLRTPLDELIIHEPALGERVKEVSWRLEGAAWSFRMSDIKMNISEKIAIEDEARNHLNLAREWGDLLKRVRAIPRFQTFLQPSSCSGIMENLPKLGIVVVINVHEKGCNAIALRDESRDPLHIPLPALTVQKINCYRNLLKAQLCSHGLKARDASIGVIEEAPGGFERALVRYRGRREDEDGVHLVLEGLWHDIVKPILSILELLRDTSFVKMLPRIWWCPTGPLSFLPLHAAGNYRGEKVESTMDYAVSSYTPTVTALTQRVKANHLINQTISGLFLTCQPKAPGVPPITGTINEVTSIHERAKACGVRSLKLEGDAVTPEDCLKHMERYSSIHLACHASQNVSEPLQSRFIFHGGKLSLGTIIKRNLKNADLAFLSACETCTGEETLSDEAVHLAAGMLAAGYRRVVATMWSIKDQYAPNVSDDFYDHLWALSTEEGGTGFDGACSAYAIHHATQRLRKRLDNSDRSLLSWIPYVHFGH
ncbi:hypothetical protein FA13DRAFT_161614 [Coprinellus micaceus]|uniref:CHAT domain-containing protein n=1 Tax=Coprinellus micaceus TaxID=71717 RepID=A0A4Y7THB9_COPMI|nr:hypothetical protein FA13DRAFT_161614 [Coprinellus micaceus]